MVQVVVLIGLVLLVFAIAGWAFLWPLEIVFPSSFTEVAESEEFRSYLTDKFDNAGFIWGRRDDGRYYLVLYGFINRHALRRRWPESRA